MSEIFIRINSKGVPLSSADFAMSKIATYGDRGRNLRKLIDYFCHLAVAPHAYADIKENDTEFAASPYLSRHRVAAGRGRGPLRPDYGDVIRVAGLVGFSRGKASAIVSELSGRDPETRKVDEARIPVAYDKLGAALLQIVKKYHFENFLMTDQVGRLHRARHDRLEERSQLRLRPVPAPAPGRPRCRRASAKRIVRRWFVMSMLTGRHSGSFESTWEQDIRRIGSQGAANYLKQIEESELSDAFWSGHACQPTWRRPAPSVRTSRPSWPRKWRPESRGFLSKSITVRCDAPALRRHPPHRPEGLSAEERLPRPRRLQPGRELRADRDVDQHPHQ